MAHLTGEPPAPDRAGTTPADAPGPDEDATPCIVARGVRKTYRSAGVPTQVLRGVDLSVPAGSFTVLLGPSGCGKTTLLNLLGGLDVADSGELKVAGVALDHRTPPQLSEFRRRTVGFVFQAYNLMPTLTAQENLEIVLEPLRLSRPIARKRAREILALVGLERLAGRFPAQLSGGEQQRVAIARALIKAPSVVLADEPTGNLDKANGRQVIDLMKRYHRENGTAFFIVTHDPAVANEASLTIRMEDGMVQNGDPP
ncbi:MAG TPA: ABC transporter ATP-binding protein [Kofleriaceae bacterium]|jgi:putative ABC transport system ATP-binding protein|nr:ABC transporter ATP-binding protein [Kofleriaceae bacterium]